MQAGLVVLRASPTEADSLEDVFLDLTTTTVSEVLGMIRLIRTELMQAPHAAEHHLVAWPRSLISAVVA